MPEPLSSKSGFGMNVTILPCFRAMFLMTYLYNINLSAIFVSVSNRMSISDWPAVATSWWCNSTWMPTSPGFAPCPSGCPEVVIGGTGK